MKLPHLSVRRPVTLAMCLLATVVLGIIAFRGLGIDMLPNIEYPTLAVVTLYPNADPESVENDVTRPIEQALATLPGLRELESTSMEHASVVLVTMEWGRDLNAAFEEINALLSVVAATLPSDAQRPIVAKLDTSQLPVLTVGVTGESDPAELTAKVERTVVPALERVAGVAQVSVVGGAYKQIAVYYDTEALRSAYLTPLDLQTMLQYQNAVVPAGSLVVDPQEVGAGGATPLRLPVRVGGTIDSVDALRELVVSIGQPDGPEDPFGLSGLRLAQPIRLGDVADVVEEMRTGEGFTRINGEPAVVLYVLKQSGANTVAVSQGVRAALDRLNAVPDLGLQLYIVTDQADFITASIDNLKGSLLIGAGLALTVLLVFLGSVRDLLVVGISIPLSLLIALLLLYLNRLTLNLMTLGGLAIAVGTLVDNAIVVLENIFRLRAEGKDRITAAVQGASEMAAAVTASTLTNVVVFAPLIFLRSLAGYLFKELALSITFAMLASLAVALTVVPMLAAHLPDSLIARRKHLVRTLAGAAGWQERLRAGYAAALRRFLKKPVYAFGIAAASVTALAFLPGVLEAGFVPEMDGSMVTIELTLPPGTPVTVTDATVRRFEEVLASVPEVRLTSVQVGSQGGNDYISLIRDAPVNQATITALLTPVGERSRSAHEVAEALRTLLPVPEGAHIRISADRAVDALGDDFALGLTLEVLGPDWEELRRIADVITRRLRETPGLADVTSTAEQTQPVLFYEVNRMQAARAYMASGQIGLTVRAALSGLEATTLHVGGRSLPVVIKPKPEEVHDLAALGGFRLFNLQTDAQGVPQVARLRVLTTADSPRLTEAPRVIQHVDRQRVAVIKARLDGLDLSEARRRAEEIVAGLDLPAGYAVRLAGIHATLDESLQELWLAVGFAVLFVYMVMAAQFESLRYPVIVMITVPLGCAGALAGLLLAGEQLNVPAFMGLITLVGISVNNGIVLVDTVNRLRRSGVDTMDDAIVTACALRLRPVLMTALTTILGLVPLSLGWGEGTEIQVPLAVATMSGLIATTALTLFVVPSFYRSFSGRSRRGQAGGKRRTPAS